MEGNELGGMVGRQEGILEGRAVGFDGDIVGFTEGDFDG
jgi:hypothetical protein